MKVIEASKDIVMMYAYLKGLPVPKEYTTAFLSTNEPLGQYYKFFPIDNGRVLTVAASGDHILQAVCNGAKEIDSFDINKIALYFSKLKIAAVKALTQEEFNAYYTDFENVNYYTKVKKYLDFDVRLFFDALYYSKKCPEYIDYLVDRGYLVDNSSSYYAFGDNYEKTKKNLKNVEINYYLSSLHKILYKIPNNAKYDAIFLSNIYNWLSGDELANFNSFIESNLSRVLADNGMIAVYASPYEEIAYVEEYNGHIKEDDEKVYVYYNKNNRN